jgi:predicted MPP superfamily phosphohydrolase
MIEESLVVFVYNLLMFLCVLGALLLLWRRKLRHPVALVLLLGVLVAALSFGGALYSPIDGFGKIQLLAWAVFAHYPLFLGGVAIRWFAQRRVLAYSCATLAACILLIGIDAFLIEPRWIEITRVTISTAKLQTPVRMAVVADLQTDAPGQYEERALEMIAKEKPDLILLTGDFVHIARRDQYVSASATLNEIMRHVGLDAPLGVYAVGGNVDWPDLWREIFVGLPVTTFETTSELDLGPLDLTGLTLRDSSNTTLALYAQDKFHIVLGHSPNFSLGQVSADLLIAGHTHGGQVQIPFIGPMLTLSQVPRSWASGVVTIAPGKVLVVSRGVGMERGNAPRIRFRCRPELVILDLVPSG